MNRESTGRGQGARVAWAGRYAGAALLFSLAPGFAAATAVPEPIQLAPQATAFDIPLMLDPQRMPESLGVELDGYDISAFVSPTADNLQVSLQVPLNSGAHELVVLAVYPDGTIETLSVHPLNVAANRVLAPENWSANVTLDSAYLSAKNDGAAFSDTPHWSNTGAAVINGGYAKDGWHFETQIDALHDDRAVTTASGDDWDLPNYRIALARQTDSGISRLQVGDVLVGDEGLVFSTFRRRGLSFNHSTAARGLEAEAFALQTEPTVSARDNVLYPAESAERVAGARTLLRPLSGDYQRALQLSASYLTGSTTYPGNGFYVGQPDEYAGDVTGAGLLSEWMSGSLRLQAEYASSRFDFDGEGQGGGSVDDDATQYTATLASGAQVPAGPLDQWSLRVQQSSVGRFFFSLGNRNLPGDLDTRRVEFLGSVGGISLNADHARYRNNVDDEPLVADYAQRTTGLALAYSPLSLDTTQGAWRWLGYPSVQLAGRVTDQAQDQEDAALVGYDIDNRTQEFSAALSFNRGTLSWTLQQSRIERDDRAQSVFVGVTEVFAPGPDTTTDQTALQLSWTPSSRVYLAPTAQYLVVKEDQTGREYTTGRFGFDSQFHLRPQKLILLLNYSEDRNRQDYRDPLYLNGDTLYRSLSSQLLWKLFPARGVQPGLDLYAKGSLGRFVDRAGNTVDETWQALLGASLYWAD